MSDAYLNLPQPEVDTEPAVKLHADPDGTPTGVVRFSAEANMHVRTAATARGIAAAFTEAARLLDQHNGVTPPAAVPPAAATLTAIAGIADRCLSSETASRQMALEEIAYLAGSTAEPSDADLLRDAVLADSYGLSDDDVATVLAALGDAAAGHRDHAAFCKDCEAAPDALCDPCSARLDAATAYDQLAAEMRSVTR